MEDELKIVLKSEDALRLDMQDQQPLELLLGNPVTYTGTTNYNELGNKPSINNVTLQGNKTGADLGLQNALTFDDAPTDGSTNPVTSDGIHDALAGKVDKAGDTMTGVLVVPNIVSKYGIEFQNAGGTNVGAVCQDMSNSNNQVYVDEYTAAGKRECYLFPAPTATEPTFHDILTSKNAVTVAQGGTGATTADDACANLGAVKKAGDTMTGTLLAPTMKVYDASYPMFVLQSSASDVSALGAVIESIADRRMVIRQRHASGYAEDYYCPENTASSANGQYEFLTTKDGVLAYKDQTVSISLSANTWTEMTVTQQVAPTGYTPLTRTIADGSTTAIRGYLFLAPNNMGNTAHILLYSTQAVTGTFTLRTWFVKSSAAIAL